MTESPAMPASLWQTKPWWCQPWSIILTGLAIPTGIWLLFHRLWLVLPVAAAIGIWWTVFLYLVPRQYADYVQQINEEQSDNKINDEARI